MAMPATSLTSYREPGYRIGLVSMPFAAVRLPSIALTQLRAVLVERFGERVRPEIHYLNHDFVRYFGRENYTRLSESVKVSVTGFGDWLFRDVAFPESTDTTNEYLQRYSATLVEERELVESHATLREGLVNAPCKPSFLLSSYDNLHLLSAAVS